jgi:PAS domain S-box-containing protein
MDDDHLIRDLPDSGEALNPEELRAEIARLEGVRQNLQHSLKELREIQQLARTIRSTSDSAEILAALSELLGHYLPPSELGLYLYQGDELLPVGDPSLGLRQTMHGLIEENIVHWVLEEGRPISVPDLQGLPRGHSDLLVPLIIMKSGLGVLLIRSQLEEEELTAQQLDLVSFAAGQAALALENARLLENLEESRHEVEDMLEGAADLILKLDSEGRIRYANDRTSLLGESRERLIGRRLGDFLARDVDKAELPELLASGESRWSEWLLENRALPEHGMKIASVSLSPVIGSRPGEVLSMAVLRDLTEQRKLEEQALEAEQLKAVMLAAVTVNHEINNPLTAILGNLFMLRRDLEGTAPPELLNRLNMAEESARQIERVAHKLEQVNEIKLVKYLGDTDMLDIDLSADEDEASADEPSSGESGK